VRGAGRANGHDRKDNPKKKMFHGGVSVAIAESRVRSIAFRLCCELLDFLIGEDASRLF